jgi:hypothetical protein
MFHQNALKVVVQAGVDPAGSGGSRDISSAVSRLGEMTNK